MKIISKSRSRRYATLVLALGFSVAATSGIVNAGDKPLAGAVSVSAAVNGGPSTAGVDRIDLANQILNRWQPIAEAVGQDAVTWREIFSTQFRLMDPSLLDNIAAVSPDADNAAANYARFTQAIRNAGAQAQLLAQSGKGQAKLGSSTSDFILIPIVPCRLVDTRLVGGPISSGTARNFFYYTNTAAFNFGSFQGGVPGAAGTVCPGTFFPDNAPLNGAAAITVTVISPTAAGNLIAWGGASPNPTASALNWTAGQVLANTTIIPGGGRSGVGPGGGVLDFALFYNGPSGSANFTADVVGYIVENVATNLDCVETSLTGTGTANVPNNTEFDFPTGAACPAGYANVSISCKFFGSSPAGLALTQIGPPEPTAFFACIWRNQTGLTLNGTSFSTTARCCRVPGR